MKENKQNNGQDAGQALRNGHAALNQLGFIPGSLDNVELNWMSSILGQYLKYPS